MNKSEKYLKFHINSNNDTTKINEFISNENITIEEFNNTIENYINELKMNSEKNKKMNKLYLEYCLKFKETHNKETKRINKRKETEIMINIISNYLKEDEHNIKDYLNKFDVSYSDFKKFINNSKSYYLKDIEKNILKTFLKRENDFNNDNLEKVKIIVDKISDDLVNDKPFNIYDYYMELGWDTKLLIYFLNNNKEHFSNFLIDNVKLYLKKYHIGEKKIILNDFINNIKKENQELNSKEIDNIVNFMTEHKMPYNYELFKIVEKKIKISE